MGILADFQIEKEVLITPFVIDKVPGEISSGISSYGYDCRLGTDFKIFTPTNCAVIDPKNFNQESFVSVKTKPKPDNYITIPPNSFALGVSLEKFKIPRDVLVVCLGKSTYARCGIIINVTPLEPEWEGHVTIEISNTAPLPCRVYAEEGIMQLLFFRSDVHRQNLGNALDETMQNLEGIVTAFDHWKEVGGGCRTSYADKKGRYQSQKAEVTLPFVQMEKGPEGLTEKVIETLQGKKAVQDAKKGLKEVAKRFRKKKSK